jgi:hypothetical protein
MEGKIGSRGWDCRKVEDIPEYPFSPDAEILQDKPDSDFVVGIGKGECAGGETADEVSGVHAAGRTVGWAALHVWIIGIEHYVSGYH